MPQYRNLSLCLQRHVIATTLPSVGLGRANGADEETKNNDVHVYAHPQKHKSTLLRKEHKEEVSLRDITVCTFSFKQMNAQQLFK